MNTATDIRILESQLDPANAVLNQRHPAGEPILFAVNQGQTLRIVDLEGNQACYGTNQRSGNNYSAFIHGVIQSFQKML